MTVEASQPSLTLMRRSVARSRTCMKSIIEALNEVRRRRLLLFASAVEELTVGAVGVFRVRR